MSDAERKLSELATIVADLRFDLSRGATIDALATGASRELVVERGVIAGLEIVGQRFDEGVYFVPQLLRAAETAQEALAVLPPPDVSRDLRAVTIVLGTVQGDVHDIGKNLVGEVLASAGYRVVDLGIDRTADEFVSAVVQHGAGVVGLSAMMTTCFQSLEYAVARLKEASPVAVIVGGAPVTLEFALSIGADGYGSSAFGALGEVRRLLPPER